MRYFILFVIGLLIWGCAPKNIKLPYTSVKIEDVYTDSLSIRAIEVMGGSLAFAANKGVLGTIDLSNGKVRTNIQTYDSILPEFRAVAHTSTDFFMLSVANPALLYKTGDNGQMDLVYSEKGKKVFYDAMTFWNDQEGIAIGDSVDGCISIIVTRDGGETWNKIPCSDLPKGIEGEGAFAASNTNIKTFRDKTWIVTTESQVYFSPDTGKTWEIQQTPIVREGDAQGIYSIDFYDGDLGIAIGGDYTSPHNNKANKAITKDGGKSWKLIADGQIPAYKSCVQFVPNSDGKEVVTIGFTGIVYSSDMGTSWTKLSKEPFYTLRFLNDSIAYAAGRNRISKLTFR